MIARADGAGVSVNPLCSGFGILLSVFVVLALALIVLLFVSLYRRRHGYREKPGRNKMNDRWWTNPYDLSGSLPGENSLDGSNDAVETISEEETPRGTVFFCRRCGRRIPNDSLFCQFCGTRVEE